MASQTELQPRPSALRCNVTLGLVVAVVNDESTVQRATVEVGSSLPLSFISTNDTPTPAFHQGDIVAVTSIDDDDQLQSDNWVAVQGAGQWQLCTNAQLGAQGPSAQVFIVRPGMQLATSAIPERKPEAISLEPNHQLHDMLVIPWWVETL